MCETCSFAALEPHSYESPRMLVQCFLESHLLMCPKPCGGEPCFFALPASRLAGLLSWMLAVWGVCHLCPLFGLACSSCLLWGFAVLGSPCLTAHSGFLSVSCGAGWAGCVPSLSCLLLGLAGFSLQQAGSGKRVLRTAMSH